MGINLIEEHKKHIKEIEYRISITKHTVKRNKLMKELKMLYDFNFMK